jgi:hypothetical protein
MSSTCLELQPFALQSRDLLRPLGAFEELFCLFDQHFPTNHAFAAQITGHTTVQQWRDALDAVQQRHPLLSAAIDTTFNRVLTSAVSPDSTSHSAWLHRPMPGGSGRLPKK